MNMDFNRERFKKYDLVAYSQNGQVVPALLLKDEDISGFAQILIIDNDGSRIEIEDVSARRKLGEIVWDGFMV